MEPMAMANILAKLFPPIEEIDRISVAAPGFINFFLASKWLSRQVEEILSAGEAYGNLDMGKSSKVQIEFVSVNPTGPIHIGHGRGAVLGSTLANVLSAAGYSTEKEYYVNNTGNQMDVFYRSLYCRYLQALGKESEMPLNGYQGSYPMELAQEIIAEKGDAFLALSPEEAIQELGRIGQQKTIAAIQSDLESLGVTFDVWFSERSLFENNQYEQAMTLLREGRTHRRERRSAVVCLYCSWRRQGQRAGAQQ